MQTISNVPVENISNCLVTAFEGGSNYWYEIAEEHRPINFNNTPAEDRQFKHISYPMNEGGSLVITLSEDMRAEEGNEDEDPETWTLNLETIAKGLEVMKSKHKSHYDDMVDENDDSTTGDVLLQCCLFGEVIYG